MRTTKKRVKRYQPRMVSIPDILQVRMTADEHPGLALELHLAIVSMIGHPTIAACNQLSHRFSCIAGGMSHANKGAPILARMDAASVAIKSAIQTIEDIVDRHGRTGGITVTDLEAKTLRAAAGKLDDALGRIPLPAYRRAVAEVDAFVSVKYGQHDADQAI